MEMLLEISFTEEKVQYSFVCVFLCIGSKRYEGGDSKRTIYFERPYSFSSDP